MKVSFSWRNGAILELELLLQNPHPWYVHWTQ
jgi:hypothetical protein